MCNETFKLVRFFSTHSRKTRFVTTPIFYVNASPHIGHLYSAVIADAVNRYYQIKNPASPSIFSTGTDEHGTKIQQAATDKNTTIKSYCDRISGDYKSVFQEAGVAYTDFIRTTEDRHLKSVHKFWNVLQEKDCIYSADYSGWYCVSDETFLTESQLKESPDGTKISLESGHPAQWTEELNYMFKLSKFQDDVVYWIKNGDRITPPKFKKILLNYLEEPLPDISVSRPSARVHWGIPVPNDPSQTIYVWLDALVNYLTCAGYPDNKYLQNWPPTDQVIGKDILKFHGVYWPAFLIAAGMEPPKRLLVHSHWTVDGQKMSKSKFNVVDPFQRAQIYSMEGLRYFLLREGVAHSDGNYSDIKVLRILNSELADTLGNLLSRACGKSLNPRQVFPQVSQQHFQDILELDATKRLIETITQLPEKCVQHYEMYNFYLVVDQAMATLHAANNFFESCRPWELKTKPISPKIPANHPSNVVVDENENAKRLETIISVTMDTLRKCAIILQPIIPHITKQLLDKLNVGADERTWDNLKVSAWDMDAKKEERSLGKSEAVLFRRIILEKDKDKKKKLTTTSGRS